MAHSPIEDLRSRNLVSQVSGATGELEAHLASGSRTLYCGFDPTAPSLHIGNLVPLLGLRRFQLAGHKPLALVGGATGLIGDPSFKDSERSLNERDVVASWVERLRGQVSQFLDFEGASAAQVVNNLDWTQKIDVVTYLRDIGKHFSVNAMMNKESVKSRIEREGAGISYTEFSYSLLQALDYQALARDYGCSLQLGGSDQWGNIVAGMDLVRRSLDLEAHALTFPLVSKADGTKFGKSEGGSIWLDPTMTSPYRFYQFWLNTADADVLDYLHYFTFLSGEEIAALGQSLAQAPHLREAQQALAVAVTRLVHGEDGVSSAQRISGALFGGSLQTLSSSDLGQLSQDGLDSTQADTPSQRVVEALVTLEMAKSNSNAMQLIKSGAVSVNGQKVPNAAAELQEFEVLSDPQVFLLRRGKKAWGLVKVNGDGA